VKHVPLLHTRPSSPRAIRISSEPYDPIRAKSRKDTTTAWIKMIVVEFWSEFWSVIDVSEPPLVGFNDMKE
jgi:hypothetical protein